MITLGVAVMTMILSTCSAVENLAGLGHIHSWEMTSCLLPRLEQLPLNDVIVLKLALPTIDTYQASIATQHHEGLLQH